MSEFSEIVSKVSLSFIDEAAKSPHLLCDMAKMEYYMAESYGGRVLIELLQNADDAGSNRVLLYVKGADVYFVNNGRPFDENDLIAISRSGASDKERGQSIGYRGIGFKSTSYISKEIIIYSNDAYFTFSKSLCAHILRVSENDVPTIRIPLALENPQSEIRQTVEGFLQHGYTTVFVFKNANIQALMDEVNSIGVGHFLFLNSITDCRIQNGINIEKYFRVVRGQKDGKNYILYKENNDNQEWVLYKKKGVSVAFLAKEGVIVPCPETDAVYHCFLPTLDRSIVRCKVNADFSTDPSRKHLTIDDKTTVSLKIVADILFEILRDAVKSSDSKIYKNICSLFINKNLISRANQLIDDSLEDRILNQEWLILNSGNSISPRNYKQFPRTFNIDSSLTLRTISGNIKDSSLPTEVYEAIDNVDEFICQYSQNEFTVNDIVSELEKESFVKCLNAETHTQLLANTLREVKIKSSLSPGFICPIGNILIKADNQEIHSLHDIAVSNREVDSKMKKELSERLGSSEIIWLQDQLGASIISNNFGAEVSRQPQNNNHDIQTRGLESISPYVSKWRDAESKCIEIEEILGNTATDVSFKNLGYDIESKTPDGEIRYIEVKSVKKDFAFSLTNNEYTAAHQYGENYFICLICENEHKIDVRYIRNPLSTAKFEKRIKQWEWACTEFKSTSKTFNIQ